MVSLRSNTKAVDCVILACWIATLGCNAEESENACAVQAFNLSDPSDVCPDDMSLIQTLQAKDIVHDQQRSALSPRTVQQNSLPSTLTGSPTVDDSSASSRLPSHRLINTAATEKNSTLPVHSWRWAVPGKHGHPVPLNQTKGGEWILFGVGFVLFFTIQYCCPISTRSPIKWLVLWVALGMAFTVCIFVMLGSTKGEAWLSGYVLEWLFSLDNCFVLHIVARGLQLPRSKARLVFSILVYFLIGFQMIFFMGLAQIIHRCWVIPYLLGAWLLYTSYLAVTEDEQSEEKITLENSLVPYVFKRLLGPFFSPRYEAKRKSCALTMMPVATVSLIIVSFFLEIDVTITKIEMFHNHYLEFTSSSVMTFALPDLFLVVEDLFNRFHLLKYGIAFILAMEGVSFLLHRIIAVSLTAQFVIIIVVMISCMICSRIYPESVLKLGAMSHGRGPHLAIKNEAHEASNESTPHIDQGNNESSGKHSGGKLENDCSTISSDKTSTAAANSRAAVFSASSRPLGSGSPPKKSSASPAKKGSGKA